jgi:Tol biopolymer transport system component
MKSLTSLLFLLPLFCCGQAIDLKNIPATPSLLAEGIICTGQGERDFALSPDGNEMFYTLQAPQAGVFQTIIYRVKEAPGKWSAPAIAPFAGNYSDLEPAFSPDGKKLFFASNRPVSGTKMKDFDIWVVEKKNGRWGVPQNIGSPVNTEADEFYPSITNSGNL